MQPETVGEVVRLLRSRRALEQVELARACGWRDASAVSRIETDRITPTRRTLVKLAQSLAKPGVTGTEQEVTGWLFLTAGIPPTRAEVEQRADAFPPIDSWIHPAAVFDFAWNVWRANDPLRRAIGLPEADGGRNYIEMFFADAGIRSRLRDSWERLAEATVGIFRARTEHLADQRWRRKLLARLEPLPDFGRIWERSAPGARGAVRDHSRVDLGPGAFGVIVLPLTSDPRLQLVQGIPEDAAGTQALLEMAPAFG